MRARHAGTTRGLAAAVLTACLACAGCGDDSDPATATDTPPAGGIYERFLAEHPGAELDLGHTVLLDLEAGAAGGAFDTGAEEGTDEIPYAFAPGTELTLGVAEGLSEPPELVLRDAAGLQVARVGAARRSQTVTVSGSHVLAVRHPHAGEAGAESEVIFLRPIVAEPPIGPDPHDVATVEAGMDCIRCNLRGMVLEGASAQSLLFLPRPGRQMRLDLSDFTGASIKYVVFLGTTLIDTIFDQVQFTDVDFDHPAMTGASFKHAKFARSPDCRNLPACGLTRDGTSTLPNCCPCENCLSSGPVVPLSPACRTVPLPPGGMDGVDFSGATFAGVCLTSSDLRGAVFTDAAFDATSTVARSDFSGSDLRRARFAGTDIRGYINSDPMLPAPSDAAKLFGAMLSDDAGGVTLSQVDLRGVDLHGANLRRASLGGSTLDVQTVVAGADLSAADFRGADLSRADLSAALLSAQTNFAGAKFSDGMGHGVRLACLRGGAGGDTGGCDFARTTHFKGQDLSFADLSGAGLFEADLGGTSFFRARLVGANLNYTNLKNARLIGAQLGVQPGSGAAAAQLGGAFMVNVDLTDADLRSVDLTGAHLYGDALLVRTRLDSANLVRAICAGAAFSGTLTDAVFNDAVLVNATFNGAVLTNAKFDTAYLHGADFSNASAVTGVTLRNAAVSTMPGVWTFTEQDGTPFVIDYGATQLGALATSTSVTCPNNEPGPCNSAAKLTPIAHGPHPTIPPCIPARAFCYENCLTPPNFSHTPPCESAPAPTPRPASQQPAGAGPLRAPALSARAASLPLRSGSPTPTPTPAHARPAG